MIVVCLHNAPPRLRGSLTRWLVQIAESTYVGQLSAREQERLHNHVAENLDAGAALFLTHREGHLSSRTIGPYPYAPIIRSGMLVSRKRRRKTPGQEASAPHARG